MQSLILIRRRRVVWANSQFATVSGVFLILSYESQRRMNRQRCIRLADVFSAKDVPFGVRIFNFHNRSLFVRLKNDNRHNRPTLSSSAAFLVLCATRY